MKVVIVIVLACLLEWIIRKILSVKKRASSNSIYSSINNYDNSTSVNNYSNDGKTVIHSMDELKNIKKKDEQREKIVYNENYQLPSTDLLNIKHESLNNKKMIEKNISNIEEVFDNFNVKAIIKYVTVGPINSLYEVEASKDTKLAKIAGLQREISSALAKKYVKIQAPIPGKKTCGIEVNNDDVETVYFKDTIENILNISSSDKLLIPLGKDMLGEYKMFDMNKMPYILASGAAGSGKSVFIKSIVMSILMLKKPDEVKIVLIDTKKVELSMFNGVPHLLCPVVLNPDRAVFTLKKLVAEMEHRFDVFEEKHVKSVDEYNNLVEKENENRAQDDKLNKMPIIVLIIDELTDMVKTSGDEVGDVIVRITKMGRMVGINMIISTQLPYESNVTKLIKANIPTRIAFMVPTSNDSRAIIDVNGAEDLIGHGDMLIMNKGEKEPTRILGTYVSDDEIERVVNYVFSQQKAYYDSRFMNEELSNRNYENDLEDNYEYDDPLYNDIVEFVVTTGKASASLLQRRFKLGYNRAARVIDLLEERGIIGPMDGSKPREVLVKLNKDIDDDEVI